MSTTTPAPAEDNFPTAPNFPAPPPAALVTPLAKAALEQGVSFDDVVAYLAHTRSSKKGWL